MALRSLVRAAARPILWSIAGTDSGGGAGLSADQRAADAFGVHLCPVVAAVTAQHSRAVTHVEPMPVEVLEAQLAALASDMPPQAIKTGLLGSAAAVRCVAHWVDRLRQQGPVALVVDPVLAATTGRGFADAQAVQAYRELLLPRATLITPNRHEAAGLLRDGAASLGPADLPVDLPTDLPAMGRALRALGCEAVAITGGDSADHQGRVLDWIDTPQAAGWLAAERINTPHHHGTGCTFATSAAAALALGFVPADALVLAKMATGHALKHAHAAGLGAGPVRAMPGFGRDAALMPWLSWSETPAFAEPPAMRVEALGLYAIVDSAARVAQVLDAGIRTVQLRLKTPPKADAHWLTTLQAEVQRTVTLCRQSQVQGFINDHWELAAACGAHGVHLGQEDLLALGDAGRARLQATGLQLGISSHSLWELARARALAPRYIACGPVWPTLTKAMPWRPQGLDNLAWWCAMAGFPVVAIGGILQADQMQAAASCGADGVCAVRVLGEQPDQVVPSLQQALLAGWHGPREAVPGLPHPSLVMG